MSKMQTNDNAKTKYTITQKARILTLSEKKIRNSIKIKLN